MKDKFEKFKEIASVLFNELQGSESLNINVAGESSEFLRFNNAKIRQTTHVDQWKLDIKLIKDGKCINFDTPINSWDISKNHQQLNKQLNKARELVHHFPLDPYLFEVKDQKSFENHINPSIETDKIVASTLEQFSKVDACGMFTVGQMYRGFFNSSNCEHWYGKSLNSLDYSIYASKQRAVKGSVAYPTWDAVDFDKNLKHSLLELEIMKKDWHQVKPGKYKSYLAPDAIAYLVSMLNWCGLSFQSYKQGMSCLKKMQDGLHWSNKFSLSDDLSTGGAPRFNDSGELSESKIDIIDKGVLKNFLISTKSAKEYSAASNFSGSSESLRCPVVGVGTLNEKDILAKLDRGIYFTNLHYLGWSDLNNARITGMSRFGCFWVEGGKIVAPIKEMRFDDELYHIFGEGLIDVAQSAKLIANNDTYFQRGTGTNCAPGMIISNFTLTL